MKPLTKASNVFDHVLNIVFIFTGILLAFSWLSVCFEIVMRYFVHRPQGWVLEITEYSLVWLTFLGAAWLLREDGHVKMDLLINRVSPRTNSLLKIITSSLCVILWLTVMWYSGLVVWYKYVEGDLTSWLELPEAPFYVVMPIGSFLLFIQFLRRTYGFLGGWRASPQSSNIPGGNPLV